MVSRARHWAAFSVREPTAFCSAEQKVVLPRVCPAEVFGPRGDPVDPVMARSSASDSLGASFPVWWPTWSSSSPAERPARPDER